MSQAAAEVAAPDPGPETGVVLEAEGLQRRFADLEAVQGLSLAVKAGELYGLVGPDGAGKTTTIRMLTGLMKPDAGLARVLGEPAGKGGESREAIGYMPQQYSLYGDLSIDENLSFFARLFGLKRKIFRQRRERLLEITRLAPFADRRADALSGGMYKKLALACALLHQPKVLVLDEPTNGVDPVSRRELWDLLYEFVAEGMAVLLATPYMDEAERCHRVGLIHEGQLLSEGRPAELAASFEHHTYLVGVVGEDRLAIEDRLGLRDDVLALTPHGASLRVVVRQGQGGVFEKWAAGAEGIGALKVVAPDFEDVFLGRLAVNRSADEGGDESQSEVLSQATATADGEPATADEEPS